MCGRERSACWCVRALVAVSMSFQFTAPKLAVPENAYHVEHEIAELDDALRESGRNIQNMIAPRAVCAQIRELDASVNLLYGEDLIAADDRTGYCDRR